MKSKKICLLINFISLTFALYAVTLPSHSFYDFNELYEDNHDVVTTSAGTVFGRINITLANNNRAWGDECLSSSANDKVKCQECCGLKLEAAEALNGRQESTDALYDTCIFDICATSSLPLGSTLWLLPFVFAYAGIKKYRKAQINITQVL